MMTLETLIHDTFNTPLGQTGDHEGHSVIRTENGGYWYADEVTDDDHILEVHAEIVRRVNAYPKLVEALQNLLTASENADETGYVDGEGWLPSVKGATSIATMKDSSGPPVGQQRMVRPRHEWLTQCGMSTTGMIGSGIGCGKFLTASNWMRRDGMDGRGGAFGNAPLCSECSEK